MAKLLMVVIYVMLGTMATVTDGQATCGQKMVPCAPYLNNSTAKPQNYCCNPIREAVANELPCLCNLYKDPTLLASFNVTVAEALRISRECGITTDLSACNATATSPSSAPPPPGKRCSQDTIDCNYHRIDKVLTITRLAQLKLRSHLRQ